MSRIAIAGMQLALDARGGRHARYGSVERAAGVPWSTDAFNQSLAAVAPIIIHIAYSGIASAGATTGAFAWGSLT